MHKWLGWGDRRKGYHFENLGLEMRIILKWIFKKWDGEVWTVFIWIKDRWRTRVNVVNKLLDSMKCGEFLDYLRN